MGMLCMVRSPHELEFSGIHLFRDLARHVPDPSAEPAQRLGVSRPVGTRRALRLDVPLAIYLGGLELCRGSASLPTF